MAAFFAGQRVRVVYRKTKFFGKECRVTRPTAYGWHPDVGNFIGVEVDLPCGGSFPLCVFETHELEPILPAGHTAGTESFQELMDRLNTQRVEKVEEVGA